MINLLVDFHLKYVIVVVVFGFEVDITFATYWLYAAKTNWYGNKNKDNNHMEGI